MKIDKRKNIEFLTVTNTFIGKKRLRSVIRLYICLQDKAKALGPCTLV